jgi:hypothetical protein
MYTQDRFMLKILKINYSIFDRLMFYILIVLMNIYIFSGISTENHYKYLLLSLAVSAVLVYLMLVSQNFVYPKFVWTFIIRIVISIIIGLISWHVASFIISIFK